MNPALIKLFLLLNKAAVRRMLRGAKTVRGALMLLVGLGVAVLGVCIGACTLLFMMREPEAAKVLKLYVGSARPYLSLFLLFAFLQSIFFADNRIVLQFSPAEVEFLFTAPVHRRELLLYKLMKPGLDLAVIAIAFSASPLLLFLGPWLSAFVGTLLAMWMMRLVGMAVVLLRLIVAQAAYTKVRKAILTTVMILVAAGLPQTFLRGHVLSGAGLAEGFRRSWPGRVLLAPFEVFSNAILAERIFPDLVGWGAAAATIDIGLLVLILKLDADYTEWAAAISQWNYERMQRLKRTGGFKVAAPRRAGRRNVPHLPWLWGAGPIARRQLLHVIRTSGSAILMALALSATLLILAAFASWRATATDPPLPVGLPQGGILAYVTMIFVLYPWSFRGDIDHLEFFKTLPVHPVALAVGQLAGGVLMITALQLAILAISLPIAPIGVSLTGAIVVLAVPVNLLFYAVNNLVFLFFPVRSMGASAPDFQSVGRIILSWLLHALILVPGLGIPAGLGDLAYLETGRFWLAALTAWLVLVMELPPLVMLVAWAFQQFDPGTEVPAS